MKTTLTLLFFTFCCLSKTIAQSPLVADAGPDKYWCMNMAQSDTDTPRLGGTVVGSGGVPPYTYSWSFRAQNYIYNNRYLDSFTIAHPKVTEIPQSINRENTGMAILVVRDANGAEAKDSVPVFFQKMVAALGTISTMKRIDDTIRISAGQVQDQFPPYHNYRWSPAVGLIDSTESNPLCYTRAFSIYNVSYIDSVGCYLCCGQAIIEIRPTGIETTSNTKNGGAMVFVNSDHQLSVFLSDEGKGKLYLHNLEGKKIANYSIKQKQSQFSLQDLPAGMFIYKIKLDDGRAFSGKLSTKGI